jgi:hypothetical protein
VRKVRNASTVARQLLMPFSEMAPASTSATPHRPNSLPGLQAGGYRVDRIPAFPYGDAVRPAETKPELSRFWRKFVSGVKVVHRSARTDSSLQRDIERPEAAAQRTPPPMRSAPCRMRRHTPAESIAATTFRSPLPSPAVSSEIPRRSHSRRIMERSSHSFR